MHFCHVRRWIRTLKLYAAVLLINVCVFLLLFLAAAAEVIHLPPVDSRLQAPLPPPSHTSQSNKSISALWHALKLKRQCHKQHQQEQQQLRQLQQQQHHHHQYNSESFSSSSSNSLDFGGGHEFENGAGGGSRKSSSFR